MAIVDRESEAFTDADLETLRASPAHRPEGRAPHLPPTFALSDPARLLLAVLSAGAGAIHLAMVPAHAAEWTAEGIAFAAAGFFQIIFAVVIGARPSRAALRISCLANTVFIGAWTVTRLWGPPFGPEAGVPHAVSFVDITCVGLEAMLVVVGGVLLGSAAWWCLLAVTASSLRGRMTPTVIRGVSTFSGLAVAILGALAIYSALR
jgi:hypothetical protein